MKGKVLNGKGCVILIRSGEMSEERVEAQRRKAMAYAMKHGLKVLSVLVREGVSGTGADNASMLDEIFQQRRTDGNFEVLLATDWTRITRESAGTSMAIADEMASAGIRIVTVDEGIVEPCDWIALGARPICRGGVA